MIPPNKLLQALGEAKVDLSTGTYEILFTNGITSPDLSDTGIEFESDITGAGGVITHRQEVPGVTWSGRVLDAPNFTINDPGTATQATYAFLIRQGGSGAASNRVVAVEDIADITWDGVNDAFNFHENGIFKIGA